MMQEKKTRNDHSLWKGKTSITMKELFDWLKPWLEQRIRKGNTLKRGITYKEFIGIINSYLTHSFEHVISSGRGFEFGHKFGEVRVVKTECILYNPRKYYFKTAPDGKKVKQV